MSDKVPVADIADEFQGLPLCANERYYTTDDKYPRPWWWRVGRVPLTHFVFDALGVVGILVAILQNLISNLLIEGPAALSFAYLERTFIWQTAVHDPIVASSLILLLIALIPAGRWLAADERRERRALEKRKAGILLAQGYRAYLQHVQRASGALPVVLQRSYTPQGQEAGETDLFAPLRLEEVTLSLPQSHVQDQADSAGSSGDDQSNERATEGETAKVDHSSHPTRTVESAQEALALARHGAIVILGEAGAGKTSVLRHLAREHASDQLERDKPGGRVPTFLDLSTPEVATLGLKESLRREISGIPGVDDRVAGRIVNAVLAGRSIVLVDGLDELVGKARETALAHLNALARDTRDSSLAQAPSSTPFESETLAPGERVRVQIAVGARTAGFRQGDLDPQFFDAWRLLPLGDPEVVRDLVRRIMDLARGPAAAPPSDDARFDLSLFLDELGSRPQTAQWLDNPLLLTLATLNWVQRGGMQVARARSDLFRNAIETLIDQRLAYNPGLRIRVAWLAERVALEMFRHGWRAVSPEVFIREIATHLPPALQSSVEIEGHLLDPGTVLLDWSGLFYRSGENRYTAFHLTFLEYLAGRGLARDLTGKWPNVVAPQTLLDAARSPGSRDAARDASRPVGSPSPSAVSLIWSRRTSARWREVFAFMTETLQEPRNDVGWLDALNRPDIAIAWVRALLDQPDDVGSLGLQLAAHCVALLDQGVPASSVLANEVAARLVAEMRNTVRARLARQNALRRACDALARGEQGRAALVNALADQARDPYAAVREAVASTLYLLGARAADALAILEVLLGDDEDAVRQAAMRAIGAIGPSALATLPTLREVLADSRTDLHYRTGLVESALEAIDGLGSVAVEALPEIRNILSAHPAPQVQTAAVFAIGSMGAAAEAALPELLAVLGDVKLDEQVQFRQLVRGTFRWEQDQISDDPRIAVAVVLTYLVELGVPVREHLQFIAREADSATRRGAVAGLGALAQTDPAIQAVLNGFLSDDDEDIRATAARNLIGVGQRGLLEPSAIKYLRPALSDAAPGVRWCAVLALATLEASVAAAALPELTELLTDTNETIRATAVLAIAHIGTYASGSLADIRVLGADESEVVRLAVIQALSQMGRTGSEAADDILPYLEDASARVRATAAAAIGSLGDAATSVLPSLCILLRDPSWDVQQAAAHAIGELGSAASGALPMLVELLDLPVEDPGRIVEAQMAALTRPSILPPVFALMTDPAADVRSAAAMAIRALGEYGLPALPQLRQLLTHPTKDARLFATELIGGLGPTAIDAKDDLRLRLADDEIGVRLAAIAAIAAVSAPTAPPLQQLLEQNLANLDEVRQTAALVIAELAGRGNATLDDLRSLLTRDDSAVPPDSAIQIAVARACAALGEQAAGLLPEILAIAVGRGREEARRAALNAVGALGRAGLSTTSTLLPLLGDYDAEVRRAAASAVGALGAAGAPVLTELLDLVDHKDKHVREAAVQAIGAMAPEGEDALFDLIDLLAYSEDEEGHPNWDVQQAAVKAIAALGSSGAKALPKLRELLRDPYWGLREAAADAVGALGLAAAPAAFDLIDLLGDTGVFARPKAERAIGQLGAAGVEVLPYLLGLFETNYMWPAIHAIGNMGAAAEPALSQLTELLSDQRDSIREAAAYAVGMIGPIAAPAVSALLPLLHDPEPRVRRAAISAVSMIGEPAAAAVHDLARLAADRREEDAVRWSAGHAIAALGDAGRPAWPALVCLLEDPQRDTRISAAAAIGQLGAPGTDLMAALAARACESEWSVRAAAVSALGQIGPSARAALPELLAALADTQQPVRSNAAYAFVAVAPDVASAMLPELQAAFASGQPRGVFSWYALDYELGYLSESEHPTREDVPRLFDLLAASQWSARERACTLLAKVRRVPDEVVTKLVDLHRVDPSPAVREMAEYALEEILSLDPDVPEPDPGVAA